MLHAWRDHELAAARARGLRARVARRGARGAGGDRASSPSGGSGRGPSATSARPTACATRSPPRAGTCATWPEGFRLVPRGDARPRLRAARRCGRRCAARARCASCGRPSGRWRPSRGSARTRRPRAGEARARAVGARPARATTRASSRLRAVPLRRRVRARRGRAPLLVCLDQVTDPRNLGAVFRSAEGAGATGVVLPAHGSARVTPAVCRASAGAVEHLPVAVVHEPRALPREVKGGDLWVYGAAGEARHADVGGRPRRRRRARLRGRGQRPATARPADLRRAVSIPLPGGSSR